ncbi:hypothetical protein [Spongiactinospora gelatinilytica]|nr:hypothetical protein [Spongiactinospora gelatinilytica]
MSHAPSTLRRPPRRRGRERAATGGLQRNGDEAPLDRFIAY